MAVEYKDEAERIRIVAKEKTCRLGIANQRREIACGLEESMNVLNAVRLNSQEASALIVSTQRYDTLQAVDEHFLLMPKNPSAATDMQLTTSFAAANFLGKWKRRTTIQPGRKITELKLMDSIP